MDCFSYAGELLALQLPNIELERGQTKLSFASFSSARPSSSSSSTSTSSPVASTSNAAPRASTSGSGVSSDDSSSSRETREVKREQGRGRGQSRERGRGRGRGRGARRSGGFNSRQNERLATVAAENESLHIPLLVSSSPELRAAISNSVSYGCSPVATKIGPPVDGGTKFRFRNCDSFDAAEECVRKVGPDVVGVLNMANAFHPGGGYINGAMAQEEALCRRSTLYAHIAQSQFYPMHEQGGLWSEGVRVFRKGDDDENEVLDSDRQFCVGVISVAALRDPPLTDGGEYANAQDRKLTRHKIITILRIAKHHNQKILILGAFGCGAFRNPPTIMAQLFLSALTKDPEFKDQFEEVVFAILERSGSNNLLPWLEVWKDFAEFEKGEGEKKEEVELDEGESQTETVDDDGDVIVVEATPLPVASTSATVVEEPIATSLLDSTLPPSAPTLDSKPSETTSPYFSAKTSDKVDDAGKIDQGGVTLA